MKNNLKTNLWQTIKYFELKNRMKLVWIIRFTIATLFVLSAGAKLFPIDFFEKQLVIIAGKQGLLNGFTNWCTAPSWARLIIIAELFLGLSLLIPYYLRKFTVPLSISILLAFILHLGYQISLFGNTGNCGCMGELLPMSPLSAIIKNVITILFLVYLYISDKHYANENPVFHFLLLPIISLWVYIFFPNNNSYCIQNEVDSRVNKETFILNQRIDKLQDIINSNKMVKPLDTISILLPIKKSIVSEFHNYKEFDYHGKIININIDEDKTIVCVFNPDCDHCLMAAKELKSFSKNKNGVKTLFLFFNPDIENESDMKLQISTFMKNASADNPYKIVNKDSFNKLLINLLYPPRVTFLENGKIMYDYLGEGEIDFTKLKKMGSK
jgi:hypothetical protein